MNKKSQGWLKFIRLLIYAISIIGTTVGASLIKTGSLSASYADGTFVAKIHNGEVIFFTSLIILSANIMWGILRWFLRGYREKWRAGRIIGKLIGGGIWRTLVIIPLIIISMILITPVICNLIEENVLSEQISFEPYDPDYAEHRLEYLEEHLEELDPQEIYEEISELTLSNIRFGTDEEARENNTSTANASIFTNNAYAYTPTVAILNKAKLSSKGHFVIFYTSYGDDAISDESAEGLGETLEKIITNYKNNLGFEYNYRPYGALKLNEVRRLVSETTETKIKATLILNNISPDIISTAMPVYVANPYRKESMTLASYVSADYMSIAGRIGMYISEIPVIGSGIMGDNMADGFRLADTAPTFPFINITPGNMDIPQFVSVTAHELGHHYAHLYTTANNLKNGGENFVKETIPNWMVVNVLSNEPVDNFVNRSHNKTYLDHGTDLTPYQLPPGCEENSGCDGYPLTAFLQNYYENVEDGKTKIMNTLPYDNEEALKHLYNQAGAEQFTKAMISLAEKNLTGDYGGKLINMTTPKGKPLECTDACLSSYTVAPAATSYLYFSTTEYENAKVTFTGSDTLRVSILGLASGGRFEIISSGNIEKEYQFSNTGRFAEYEVTAFAVANISVSSAGVYKIEIESEELDDIVDNTAENDTEKNSSDDRTLDFSDLYKITEPGCYELNTDKIFDLLISFVGIGSDFINILSELNTSGFTELKATYEQSNTEAIAHINEAKDATSGYRITVCFSRLKKGTSLNDAKSRAFFKRKLNFLNAEIDSVKISGYAGVDLLTRIGKIYLLTEQKNNTTMLVTITVAKR